MSESIWKKEIHLRRRKAAPPPRETTPPVQPASERPAAPDEPRHGAGREPSTGFRSVFDLEEALAAYTAPPPVEPSDGVPPEEPSSQAEPDQASTPETPVGEPWLSGPELPPARDDPVDGSPAPGREQPAPPPPGQPDVPEQPPPGPDRRLSPGLQSILDLEEALAAPSRQPVERPDRLPAAELPRAEPEPAPEMPVAGDSLGEPGTPVTRGEAAAEPAPEAPPASAPEAPFAGTWPGIPRALPASNDPGGAAGLEPAAEVSEAQSSPEEPPGAPGLHGAPGSPGAEGPAVPEEPAAGPWSIVPDVESASEEPAPGPGPVGSEVSPPEEPAAEPWSVVPESLPAPEEPVAGPWSFGSEEQPASEEPLAVPRPRSREAESASEEPAGGPWSIVSEQQPVSAEPAGGPAGSGDPVAPEELAAAGPWSVVPESLPAPEELAAGPWSVVPEEPGAASEEPAAGPSSAGSAELAPDEPAVEAWAPGRQEQSVAEAPAAMSWSQAQPAPEDSVTAPEPIVPEVRAAPEEPVAGPWSIEPESEPTAEETPPPDQATPDAAGRAPEPEPERPAAKPAPRRSRRRGRRRGHGHATTRVVGLRIGSSQLAAAHVVNNGSAEVVQLARTGIDRGLVVGGEVRDVAALTHALKKFFAANKLPRKDVRLGIASSRIGVRVLDVPAVDDPKQFENAIRFRVQELLPIPVTDAILDHVVVAESESEEGEPMRRILLVFAHRELVGRYVEVCRGAGVRLSGIDLDAFGLLRAAATPRPEGSEPGNALVAVAVGHERTVLAVSDGRICSLARVLEWGGSSLDVAIARALDLAPSQAEPLKRGLSLDAAEPPEEITPLQLEAVKAAMQSEIAVLGRELVSSLRFYQSRPDSLAIGEVLLSGGGAQLGGLVGELEQLLGAPVRSLDPFARVTLGRKVAVPDDPGSLAIAVGLGIED